MKFEGKPRVELLEREQRAPGSALSLNASAGVGGKQKPSGKTPHAAETLLTAAMHSEAGSHISISTAWAE